MEPRSLNGSAPVPAETALRTVVVGVEANEVEMLSTCLAELRAGRVLEFRKITDMLSSPPADEMDLLVLTGKIPQLTMENLLRWTRKNWPSCQAAVLCDESNYRLERMIRINGVLFFVRPVLLEQWKAMLQGAKQIQKKA